MYSIKNYVINGGELFTIKNIDRYRDGVKCCGGVGILVIETTGKNYLTLLYDGSILKSKEGKIYNDENFKLYIVSLINIYIDGLSFKINHSKNLLKSLAPNGQKSIKS